ncbi:MAG TPA: MBL fold metallo-hydrolase [Ignavibacteriaceae bacterium]|nr:MBL fold metallo-hydrolase [Ignavibacteriaceae bacterium]
MKRYICSLLFVIIFFTFPYSKAQNKFESDLIKTLEGNIKITFIKHASLLFDFNGIIVYADPVSRYADFSKMPKADIILVTHHHGDHFDPKVIKELEKKNTRIIYTLTCAETMKGGTKLKNGDYLIVDGIEIVAVPAYNLVHKRDNGKFYHPKGMGNGYVIRFGKEKIYIAGDTENVPEMKNLNNIDIAFLPMNLPYTMTPEMVTDAVKMFKPNILYPYHTGNTDISELTELLKNETYCQIRIRKMQ